MKTNVPLKKTFLLIAIPAITLFSFKNTLAQTTQMLTNGLSFVSPVLVSGTNLQQGSVYLFSNVSTGVDATVRVDSLVNNATLITLDDNSNGVGYRNAFQPRIQSGNVIGKSYVVFKICFYEAGTTNPVALENVNATAIDIDGNATLKEFARIDVGAGGTATYMSTTTDLSILQLLPGDFIGENILGIERSGIDTSSYANMFTASNTNISSFTVRYGTNTTLPSTTQRQFSLYMKGFTYPNQTTLPLELLSFNAILNKNKVDLNWVTLWEKNLSHFEVERSFDGKEFTQIASVFGVGNSDFKSNYSFSDHNLGLSDNTVSAQSRGIIYYRLKLMDIDGKYGYSDIRVIRIGKFNEAVKVMTYPNPVVNDVRITVPNEWQGKEVKYDVFNASGRMVYSIRNSSASQTEVINMSGMGKGFYVVKVSMGAEVVQQKIIKN